MQTIQKIKAQNAITDGMIQGLVDRFYVRVREDSILGHLFEARVSDWDYHLQRMRVFWRSVVLMSGEYHGSPMQKHLPLPVDSVHFDRWLAIFVETAREVCPPSAAEVFIKRAAMIARSLEMGIASSQGAFLTKGERFTKFGETNP